MNDNNDLQFFAFVGWVAASFLLGLFLGVTCS